MVWLGCIGIMTLALGVFYFFLPTSLKLMDEWGKDVVVTVEHTLKYHKLLGILFLLAAVAMIYIGFVLT